MRKEKGGEGATLQPQPSGGRRREANIRRGRRHETSREEREQEQGKSRTLPVDCRFLNRLVRQGAHARIHLVAADFEAEGQ